jgi:sugar lactone lactonase YvrE
MVLALADGAERRRFELPQTVVHQGLAVHAGGIVVSCRDGMVIRFDE